MVAFMLFHTNRQIGRHWPTRCSVLWLDHGVLGTRPADFSWPWLLLGNDSRDEACGPCNGTNTRASSAVRQFCAFLNIRFTRLAPSARRVPDLGRSGRTLPILVSAGHFLELRRPDEGSVTVSVVQPTDCYDKFAAGTERCRKGCCSMIGPEASCGSGLHRTAETVWPYAYDERHLPQAPVVTPK